MANSSPEGMSRPHYLKPSLKHIAARLTEVACPCVGTLRCIQWLRGALSPKLLLAKTQNAFYLGPHPPSLSIILFNERANTSSQHPQPLIPQHDSELKMAAEK